MASNRLVRNAPGVAIGLATALLVTAAAHAQDAAKADEGSIKYRQSLMESIGGDMGAIADLMKYGMPLLGNAAVHAEGMNAHSKLIASAFERKVTAGRTDAKPEIWNKPDEFQQKAKDFETETAKLVEAAQSKDPAKIGPQLKATGKACGSCHDTFRKPKEESYKRSGGGDE